MLDFVSPIELVKSIGKGAVTLRAGALTDIAKLTRIEPIVLVDERVAHLPMMPDVMQSITSIFAGYYLQAVALQTNVGSVDTIKLLDALNPNRDSPIAWNALKEYTASKESRVGDTTLLSSYQLQLPVPNNPVGLEHYGLENDAIPNPSGNSVKFDTKDVRESASLAVGKLITVNIKQGSESIPIPVSVRMIPAITDSAVIKNILSVGSKETNLVERYHKWRSGEIDFITDFILCQDLIDEHRRAVMKDSEGHYRAILDRRNTNRIAAISSGSQSLASASNVIIMSDDTKREFERDGSGMKLSSFKARERIFEETFAMLLVVIDTKWNSVTIYHRGLDVPSEFNERDLKSAGKAGGTDIGEILRAYQLGNTPAI